MLYPVEAYLRMGVRLRAVCTVVFGEIEVPAVARYSGVTCSGPDVGSGI